MEVSQISVGNIYNNSSYMVANSILNAKLIITQKINELNFAEKYYSYI